MSPTTATTATVTMTVRLGAHRITVLRAANIKTNNMHMEIGSKKIAITVIVITEGCHVLTIAVKVPVDLMVYNTSMVRGLKNKVTATNVTANTGR